MNSTPMIKLGYGPSERYKKEEECIKQKWMVTEGLMIGWLVVLFYGISTLFRSFNTKLSHSDKSFKQFSLA